MDCESSANGAGKVASSCPDARGGGKVASSCPDLRGGGGGGGGADGKAAGNRAGWRPRCEGNHSKESSLLKPPLPAEGLRQDGNPPMLVPPWKLISSILCWFTIIILMNFSITFIGDAADASWGADLLVRHPYVASKLCSVAKNPAGIMPGISPLVNQVLQAVG
jgi:hypothetical protein